MNSISMATSSSPLFGMNGFADLNKGVHFVGFMAGGSKAEGSELACKGTRFQKEEHEGVVQPAKEVKRASSPVECSQQH